ncbi:MAG: DUF4410 domain-containing protein [Planctomycetota bacterium]|nr:DUF4410 domain-containing protein [Planctomycetota bacterium]
MSYRFAGGIRAAGFAAISFAAMAAGCGSPVNRVYVDLPPGTISSGNPIYVKDFDASKTVFKGEYSDDPNKVEAERKEVPKIMSAVLVSDLCGKGFAAKEFAGDVPGDAIVVTGEVIEINHGSGHLRFWVGMGAGAARMSVLVRIYRAGTPGATLGQFDVIASTAWRGEGVFSWQDFTRRQAAEISSRIAKYLKQKAGR